MFSFVLGISISTPDNEDHLNCSCTVGRTPLAVDGFSTAISRRSAQRRTALIDSLSFFGLYTSEATTAARGSYNIREVRTSYRRLRMEGA